MSSIVSEMPPSFWFFFAVGLLTLVVAGRFAFRPMEKTLAVLRPLYAATAAAAVAAFLMGSTNLLVGVHRMVKMGGADAVQPVVIIGGACEALVTPALGAAFLAVAWLFAAVGFHRQA